MAVACTSQTLLEPIELPLAAPVTPVAWPLPIKQPASLGFEKLSAELRIGWMASHNTRMLTLTSVTPSPFTSTHAKFCVVLQGLNTALVGVAVNWVELMTCSMVCCAADSACLRCCMLPTICRSLLPSLKEATASKEIRINMIIPTTNVAPRCREDGEWEDAQFMANSCRPDCST